MSVTPIAGVASSIVVGGTAVTAIAANPNGGLITNGYTAADQGLASAEPLYINAVTTAGVLGNGTTFALQPGQSWSIIPGQTTPTSVNALTSGHQFSVTSW